MSHAQYFTATTDLWSSAAIHQLHSPLCWGQLEAAKLCLQTMYCPEDHTGENLAPALESTLEAWKLELSYNRQWQQLPQSCKAVGLAHISCFGHNLHLAVTTAKDGSQVSRAYGICHKIVNTFSHSWKKGRGLTQARHSVYQSTHCVGPAQQGEDHSRRWSKQSWIALMWH